MEKKTREWMSFPVSIMENAKRMLRFSIRSNISATYIRLYSVAFIWLVLLLAGDLFTIPSKNLRSKTTR
ncbi:hypothetical protein J0B03_10865 [Alkalibacter rhizosphaerae]|uniref:Uncharacterized protein n=1 Tax=Alkalibacter rhizosphaerae TaxID=2815577 RepID=A0A974XEA8_9FIRM|nr:hypothetical protein [Alkalibacter rhizosphaerae]QSX08277.1 hypothetical protein J0B03_10865 [Alkalibacter rhizosphaerae]